MSARTTAARLPTCEESSRLRLRNGQARLLPSVFRVAEQQGRQSHLWSASLSQQLAILTPMLAQTLEEGRKVTDEALERLIPSAETRPAAIHRAMRHSVFAGGKRIRPILCMESGRAVGGVLPTGIEEL